MGQEHDVVHRDELLRHARLVLEDVEPGGQDLLLLQRRDEGALVDDRCRGRH
jgi:hypothetical protein